MKVNFCLKMIFIFSLISMSLSFSMMFGKYTKESFKSSDIRVSASVRWMRHKIFEKKGAAYESLEIYPLAVYRQIVNGINYKIITAVKDEKNKKVSLMDSTVYSELLSKYLLDPPYLTDIQEFNSDINIPIETDSPIYRDLEKFIMEQLLIVQALVSIKSIVKCPSVVELESFYLINANVTLEEQSTDLYIIISMNEQGFKILQTLDFPEA